MKRQYSITSNSVNDLDIIAGKLLETYPENRLFAFYGEMGAGKTTFIKVLCKRMGVKDAVSSPTFALVNVYEASDNVLVNHFDCYRMQSLEEAFDIGYEDYFYGGDYCFIEWPEKIEQLLPEESVRVTITIDKTNETRLFTF